MPAVTKIGVLHASNFTARMQDNFISGLQSTGHWPDGSFDIDSKHHEGKYGRDADGNNIRDLETSAADFANRGVKLIVAAGLVAVDASFQATDVPTVGLIGRLPRSSSDPGYEAINHNTTNIKRITNMDTASHNDERRDRLLSDFAVGANEIALMVNGNSKMGDAEADEWVASGAIAVKYPDLAGSTANDHLRFQAFFRAVPAGIKALIVSSDPFFFRFRSRLIAAANAVRPGTAADPKFIFCFPFAEWQFTDNGDPLPEWDPGCYRAFAGTGLDLLPAYRQLGICALDTLALLFP
ncbi:MAG TPA: hypothetical protein VKP67_05015 [Xanthobacteraceae bacterium]|nr:hypothetical protein [Xanthobacteraceae bacterium]